MGGVIGAVESAGQDRWVVEARSVRAFQAHRWLDRVPHSMCIGLPIRARLSRRVHPRQVRRVAVRQALPLRQAHPPQAGRPSQGHEERPGAWADSVCAPWLCSGCGCTCACIIGAANYSGVAEEAEAAAMFVGCGCIDGARRKDGDGWLLLKLASPTLEPPPPSPPPGARAHQLVQRGHRRHPLLGQVCGDGRGAQAVRREAQALPGRGGCGQGCWQAPDLSTHCTVI